MEDNESFLPNHPLPLWISLFPWGALDDPNMEKGSKANDLFLLSWAEMTVLYAFFPKRKQCKGHELEQGGHFHDKNKVTLSAPFPMTSEIPQTLGNIYNISHDSL